MSYQIYTPPSSGFDLPFHPALSSAFASQVVGAGIEALGRTISKLFPIPTFLLGNLIPQSFKDRYNESVDNCNHWLHGREIVQSIGCLDMSRLDIDGLGDIINTQSLTQSDGTIAAFQSIAQDAHSTYELLNDPQRFHERSLRLKYELKEMFAMRCTANPTAALAYNPDVLIDDLLQSQGEHYIVTQQGQNAVRDLVQSGVCSPEDAVQRFVAERNLFAQLYDELMRGLNDVDEFRGALQNHIQQMTGNAEIASSAAASQAQQHLGQIQGMAELPDESVLDTPSMKCFFMGKNPFEGDYVIAESVEGNSLDDLSFESILPNLRNLRHGQFIDIMHADEQVRLYRMPARWFMDMHSALNPGFSNQSYLTILDNSGRNVIGFGSGHNITDEDQDRTARILREQSIQMIEYLAKMAASGQIDEMDPQQLRLAISFLDSVQGREDNLGLASDEVYQKMSRLYESIRPLIIERRANAQALQVLQMTVQQSKFVTSDNKQAHQIGEEINGAITAIHNSLNPNTFSGQPFFNALGNDTQLKADYKKAITAVQELSIQFNRVYNEFQATNAPLSERVAVAAQASLSQLQAFYKQMRLLQLDLSNQKLKEKALAIFLPFKNRDRAQAQAKINEITSVIGQSLTTIRNSYANLFEATGYGAGAVRALAAREQEQTAYAHAEIEADEEFIADFSDRLSS